MKHEKHLAMFLVVLIISVSLGSCAYDFKRLNGFKCPGITKLNQAIRLNEKNRIECFSINGNECASFSNDQTCRQFIENHISRLVPVTCGEGNRNSSGSPSWCIEAEKFYFNRWLCYKETGIKTGIRLSRNGNVQCLSKNGRDCVWGDYGNKICKKIKYCTKTQRRMKRLTCGSEKFKKIWGHNGYLFAFEHWCKKGFAFYFYTGNFLCRKTTGISTPIRLAINGDMECLSNNRRKCIWGVRSNCQCNTLIKKYRSRTTQLRCGKRHKKIYRMTGYRRGSHWCRRSHNLIYKKLISLNYTPKRGCSFEEGSRREEGRNLSYRKRFSRVSRQSTNVFRTQHRTSQREFRSRPIRISHQRVIKLRRSYGMQWKRVFKRRYGQRWKLRVKYGRKWKVNLRNMYGHNWRKKVAYKYNIRR